MKTLLHLLCAGLFTISGWAVPHFDPFADASGSGGTSYSVDSNLVGQNNSSTSWYLRGDNNPGSQPVIVAGNLAYPLMPPGTGNSVQVVPSTGKSACVDLGLASAHTSTVYYSFYLKITDLSAVPTTATENPIAFFLDDPSQTLTGNTIARRGARLLTKKVSSTTYVLGTGKTTSSTDTIFEANASAHNVGDILFVVGSYQRSGTSTNVHLWINPPSNSFGSSTPPTPTLIAPAATSGVGLNSGNARGFVLSCQFAAAPSAIVDEVRVATDWAFVTGGDPAILQNPANVMAPEGGTAVFNVAARGTPTLTYQWVKDGSVFLTDGGNISGATTATLTVSGISAADAGTYAAIVYNGNSVSVTSASATLALADPAITTQPQSRTNNFGTTATFQVTASGTAPFNYQWMKEGLGDLSDAGNISGSQTATLTITGVSATDAGNYSVRVSNGVSSTDSAAAALVVRDPYIVTQPVPASVIAGATTSFSVSANGSGQPFTYQWFRNNSLLSDGGNYSGTGTEQITISNISPAEEGDYTVVVTSSTGSATSTPAALTVVVPLTITAQPVARTVTAGSRAIFAVATSGSGPLTYQWLKNGSPVASGSFACTITNAQLGDQGNYSVIVTGPVNAVTSSVAALTITANVTMTPANVVVIRVGNGAQTLSANGNSMALDVFNRNGGYLSSLNIPDAGTNAMITQGPNSVPSPSSVTGTTMSKSLDGRYLVVAGYNTAAGYGAALNTSSASVVPRGIGLFDSAGAYTLGLASTDAAFSATFWRSAIADGTNNFWGSGRAPGTYYFGFDQPSALVQNTFANIRSMGLFNGSIYCVSAVSGNSGVMKLDGMPTFASAPTTVLFPGNTGFSDLDVSPSGNLIYVADDRAAASGGGIARWDFDGSTWNRTYTLTSELPNGARYVTADFSGPNPIVYAASKELTEDNNRLVRIEDTGAESPGLTVAYAGANQNFRGLRLGPGNADLPGLVNVARSGNTLTVTWDGDHALQTATSVSGLYEDVIGASSPYSVDVESSQQLYFRLRQKP